MVFGKRGKELHAAWKQLFAKYTREFPAFAEQLKLMQRRRLPEGWDKNLPVFPADAKGVAITRLFGQGPQRPGAERSVAHGWRR